MKGKRTWMLTAFLLLIDPFPISLLRLLPHLPFLDLSPSPAAWPTKYGPHSENIVQLYVRLWLAVDRKKIWRICDKLFNGTALPLNSLSGKWYFTSIPVLYRPRRNNKWSEHNASIDISLTDQGISQGKSKRARGRGKGKRGKEGMLLRNLQNSLARTRKVLHNR